MLNSMFITRAIEYVLAVKDLLSEVQVWLQQPAMIPFWPTNSLVYLTNSRVTTGKFAQRTSIHILTYCLHCPHQHWCQRPEGNHSNSMLRNVITAWDISMKICTHCTTDVTVTGLISVRQSSAIITWHMLRVQWVDHVVPQFQICIPISRVAQPRC